MTWLIQDDDLDFSMNGDSQEGDSDSKQKRTGIRIFTKAAPSPMPAKRLVSRILVKNRSNQ